MPDGIEFDATSMVDLGRKITEASHHVAQETAVALLKVGEEIKMAAQHEAAAAGSKSIPPTIRVVPGEGFVIIRAGEGVPLASLWEIGNKGSKRSATTFRHPVWGNRDVWVEQPKHRFLAPARKATAVSRRRTLEKAWTYALEPYGLRPHWEGL